MRIGVTRGILAIAAVIVVLLLAIAFIRPPGNASSGISGNIQWGSFTKISSQNYGDVTHIYYISWLGCPIGAADSWAFYLALSQYGNISSSVTPHHSDPNDQPANVPGLLFGNFTVGGIVFSPYYVYNQYLNVSISGIPLTRSNTVQVGLGELQSSLPAQIFTLEKSAMQTAPTEGMPGAPYAMPSSTYLGHINTNIIITGSKGAWILNGPLYSPSGITSYTPQQLLQDAASVQAIQAAANQVSGILSAA